MMSLTKIVNITLAIALILFWGLNLLHTEAAIARSTSNPQEIREFKQLIDRTHQAWNSHNPQQLAKFYAQDADLIFYDALPMQY